MPVATGNSQAAVQGAASASPIDPFPALDTFRIPHIPPAAYYIPDFISEAEEDWRKVLNLNGRRSAREEDCNTGEEQCPNPGHFFRNHCQNGSLYYLVKRIDNLIERSSDGDFKALDINQVLVNEYSPGQGISPHEDGPAFRPLVATLSLGAHTVLDIHHYLSTTSPSPPMITTEMPADTGDSGRPIAAIPLAHLLLMPRSLLILSSSLYASHLHGIAERSEDAVISSSGSTDQGQSDVGVVVANESLLGDASVIDALRTEGKWTAERGTRTSLTFRHANKVLKGGVLSLAHGALRRK